LKKNKRGEIKNKKEIQRLSLVSVLDDKWSWKGGPSIDFSVKFAYGVLSGESDGGF